MIIYLDDRYMEIKKEIIEMLNHQLSWNCNLNGAKFSIRSGVYNCINIDDEYLGCEIMGYIQETARQNGIY